MVTWMLSGPLKGGKEERMQMKTLFCESKCMHGGNFIETFKLFTVINDSLIQQRNCFRYTLSLSLLVSLSQC